MTIDINAIREALPHRYPMLLVDRVLEVSEDEITAIKNVTINEPFFNGHFPQYPVMPGVLIMEALAQTAGVLELSFDAYQSFSVVNNFFICYQDFSNNTIFRCWHFIQTFIASTIRRV